MLRNPVEQMGHDDDQNISFNCVDGIGASCLNMCVG